jgi:hypothetical protein
MSQFHKPSPKSLEEAMAQALRKSSRSGDHYVDYRTDADAYPSATSAVDAAMKPPAEPSVYVMTAPKGVNWNPSLEKSARQWFFNAGLPQSVVTGIMQQYCRRVCDGNATQNSTGGGGDLTGLQSEWGADWDRNVGLAREVVQNCNGGQELMDILDNSGLGNDAWLIRTLAAVSQSRGFQSASD